MTMTTKILGALALAGLTSLWAVSLYDGMVKELLVVTLNREFPDGTPLHTKYTGIYPLDFALAVLVAFFYSGTSHHEPSRYVLMEIYSLLQPGIIFFLLESERFGETDSFFLNNPAFIGFTFNAVGVACTMPLWCIQHIKKIAQYPGSVPALNKPGNSNHAAFLRSLPFTTLIGSILMPFLAFFNRSSDNATHQTFLAFMQFTPFYVSILQKLTHYGWSLKAPSAGTLYLLAGLTSAAGHLYTLYTISQSSLSFADVFIPKLEAYQGPNLETVCWLFLQHDWIISNLTALVWTVYLGANSILALIGLAVMGPGGTIGLTLWRREAALVKAAEKRAD